MRVEEKKVQAAQRHDERIDRVILKLLYEISPTTGTLYYYYLLLLIWKYYNVNIICI